MPSAKRERQREGRQARVAAAVAEHRRRQRWRTVRNFAILFVVVVGVILFLARNGDDDKSNVTAASGSETSTSTTTTTTLPAVTVPPAGASITGDTPCPPADGSAPRTTTFEKTPPMCIDSAKTYTATVQTSIGGFTIALDAAAAPNTVNNFVVLARYHYFDGVAFHRVITDFVDQTGDANGPTPGSGDPGYEFADELPTGDKPYPEGAVAMANSGPNTNGSQWFVVVGTGGDRLQSLYSKFGTVSSGLEVVRAINAKGSASGTPVEQVTITSLTIEES